MARRPRDLYRLTPRQRERALDLERALDARLAAEWLGAGAVRYRVDLYDPRVVREVARRFEAAGWAVAVDRTRRTGLEGLLTHDTYLALSARRGS